MHRDPATSPDIIFFGKMVAGATHDLNNVLAVINELRGLLSDILDDSPPEINQLDEKVTMINDRIGNQIQRGCHIIKQLNIFAHLADHTTTFNMYDVLCNLIEMTSRFANLKKSKLELIPFTESIVMSGNPLSLARVISETIFLAMESSPQPATLSIAVHASGRQVIVSIRGIKVAGDEKTYFPINDAANLVGEIGGKVELVTNDKLEATINITLTRNLN